MRIRQNGNFHTYSNKKFLVKVFINIFTQHKHSFYKEYLHPSFSFIHFKFNLWKSKISETTQNRWKKNFNKNSIALFPEQCLFPFPFSYVKSNPPFFFFFFSKRLKTQERTKSSFVSSSLSTGESKGDLYDELRNTVLS